MSDNQLCSPESEDQSAVDPPEVYRAIKNAHWVRNGVILTRNFIRRPIKDEHGLSVDAIYEWPTETEKASFANRVTHLNCHGLLKLHESDITTVESPMGFLFVKMDDSSNGESCHGNIKNVPFDGPPESSEAKEAERTATKLRDIAKPPILTTGEARKKWGNFPTTPFPSPVDKSSDAPQQT